LFFHFVFALASRSDGTIVSREIAIAPPLFDATPEMAVSSVCLRGWDEIREWNKMIYLERDRVIMDLKERLKCVEERLKDAEESRDRAWALVEGPIIHSLKVILDGTQEEMKLQQTKRLRIEPS